MPAGYEPIQPIHHINAQSCLRRSIVTFYSQARLCTDNFTPLNGSIVPLRLAPVTRFLLSIERTLINELRLDS